MIEINIHEYQINEIIIVARSIIRQCKEELSKTENALYYLYIDVKKSVWENILNELENAINKE